MRKLYIKHDNLRRSFEELDLDNPENLTVEAIKRFLNELKHSCLIIAADKTSDDMMFRVFENEGKEYGLLFTDMNEFRKSFSDEECESHEYDFELYQKIIQNVNVDDGLLILIGCDSYDVPFKSKDDEVQADASGEVYKYILCAVCPVKLSKPNLRYDPEDKAFHDGGVANVPAAPEVGFLFPAFDSRATNIYNALFYTHSPKEGHENLIDALFNTRAPKPAAEQKKSFEALLGTSLQEECSLDVVQTVHEQICQSIELHKQSRVADPLMISKEDVSASLRSCGVSQEHISKFNVAFDETFGFETQLHPKNIINSNRIEITTPDVSIQISPERSDLIETRVIGGVKYIMICADENVEVNGVPIHITEGEKLNV